MRPDATTEGGSFRATASAAIGGTSGAWGDLDMLTVSLDSNGELIVGTLVDVVGVIWVPEGRKATVAGTDEKDVVEGRKYTVFTRATFADVDLDASPAIDVGDQVWATAAGDILVTGQATGAIWIGQRLADINGIAGLLWVDINRKVPAL